MRGKQIVGIFLLLITLGCVDRVFFDIPVPAKYSVSISGYISDQPGPYTVNVYRAFDTESQESPRTGVSARSVVISDNLGNSETLKQVLPGVYKTSPTGIRGEVGVAYKVRVEIGDGRVYESIADTLRGGSKLDTTYYELNTRYTLDGIQHVIDVFVDASTDADLEAGNTYFMWSNMMSYKSTTKPELEGTTPQTGQCYRDPAEGKCNYRNPCSGLKNVGTDRLPVIVRVKPCECCTCWYEQFNDQVFLNDKIRSASGKFRGIRTDRIPVTGWNLMYKMRIEAAMQTLSPQAYRFWKGVRDQRSAVYNIFQPITGHIPGNIIQTAGTDDPAPGLFYATSFDSKVFYIFRGDVDEDIIPSTDLPNMGYFSCFQLAPNPTTAQPSYWIE